MLTKCTLSLVFTTLLIGTNANCGCDDDRPLKWGILAAGKICSDFVNSLGTLSPDDHEVVAVAARNNLTRAEAFAEKFNIPKAYAGYENLATNKDIDIVYIGNINPQHYSAAKLMLQRGKHVLIEKPLGMNYKQTRELVLLARMKNVFFAEGLWSRYLPIYQFLRQHIKNGKLGKIVSVEAELGNPRTDARFLVKELGGGVMLDFGVYGLDVLQWIFQEEPKRLKATGILSDEGVETDVRIDFDYSGNRKATLRLSISEATKNKIRIVGTKASIEVPNFWFGTGLVDADGMQHNWPLPTGAEYPFIGTNRAGLAYEADAVRKYIRVGKKQSDVAPHDVSLSIARVQDEIRKQIGVVYLNDFDPTYISPNLNINQLLIVNNVWKKSLFP